jgi:hypothetical protein
MITDIDKRARLLNSRAQISTCRYLMTVTAPKNEGAAAVRRSGILEPVSRNLSSP